LMTDYDIKEGDFVVIMIAKQKPEK
jgi:hypothetical protein